MKSKKIFFTLLIGFLQVSRADASNQISLEQVVHHVSARNLAVRSEALRVYQAKESVQITRMNLIPKLNLWQLTGLVSDTFLGLVTASYASVASGLAGMVEDIAPFLVPANWFRIQHTELLFLAEKEAYRALWANEVMTAKALYFHLLVDQTLLEQIENHQKEIRQLLLIAQSRELLGGSPQGTTRALESQWLELQEDKRALETLVLEEKNALGFMLGLPVREMIEITPLPKVNWNEFAKLDFDDFEFRVKDSSPESREMEYLADVSDSVKSEATFSWIGTPSLSRGVAGGVFDSLPIQNGFGAGTPATLRIIDAQKELFKMNQQGAQETLLRHLNILVTQYNLDLENAPNLERRLKLATDHQHQLLSRMRLGETIEGDDLASATQNLIRANAAYLEIQFRFLAHEDKLSRLLFHEDYQKSPAVVELLSSTLSLTGGQP